MGSVLKQLNSEESIMKKAFFAFAGAVVVLAMAGCAGITTQNGGVAPISAGPNFYSKVAGNSYIQPTCAKDATIVKRDVTATATLKSYFTCVSIGDVSYATLKAEALKNVKGANDLVDVKMDYDMNCICGINTITAKLTATAVARK